MIKLQSGRHFWKMPQECKCSLTSSDLDDSEGIGSVGLLAN